MESSDCYGQTIHRLLQRIIVCICIPKLDTRFINIDKPLFLIAKIREINAPVCGGKCGFQLWCRTPLDRSLLFLFTERKPGKKGPRKIAAALNVSVGLFCFVYRGGSRLGILLCVDGGVFIPFSLDLRDERNERHKFEGPKYSSQRHWTLFRMWESCLCLIGHMDVQLFGNTGICTCLICALNCI